MAYKFLVNKSNQDMQVDLITRIGPDPSHRGPTVSTFLKAGERKEIQYGSDQDPFLNGMALIWKPSGSMATQSEVVAVRGSSWDNTLNTNNTLTIEGVVSPEVKGSNS